MIMYHLFNYHVLFLIITYRLFNYYVLLFI